MLWWIVLHGFALAGVFAVTSVPVRAAMKARASRPRHLRALRIYVLEGLVGITDHWDADTIQPRRLKNYTSFYVCWGCGRDWQPTVVDGSIDKVLCPRCATKTVAA